MAHVSFELPDDLRDRLDAQTSYPETRSEQLRKAVRLLLAVENAEELIDGDAEVLIR